MKRAPLSEFSSREGSRRAALKRKRDALGRHSTPRAIPDDASPLALAARDVETAAAIVREEILSRGDATPEALRALGDKLAAFGSIRARELRLEAARRKAQESALSLRRASTA